MPFRRRDTSHRRSNSSRTRRLHCTFNRRLACLPFLFMISSSNSSNNNTINLCRSSNSRIQCSKSTALHLLRHRRRLRAEAAR